MNNTSSKRLEDLLDLDAEEAAQRLNAAVSLSTGDDGKIIDLAVRLLAAHRESAALVGLVSPDTMAEITDRLITHLDNHDGPEFQETAWILLDALRLRPFRQRVAAEDNVSSWADRIQRLVDASQLTFPVLFAQRAQRHPSRALFIVPGTKRAQEITWRQTEGRIELIARGLLAITAEDKPGDTIAILSQNRLEMALVDLACLTSGITNVMIPATASESDIVYILNHAQVSTVVASSKAFARLIHSVRPQASHLRRIICLDGPVGSEIETLPLEAVLEQAVEFSKEQLETRRAEVRLEDRASIMYTSGTTGTPKGICFSQRNIVSKRFHRALALPEIGEDDRFLCYLPLFHTFGRFFEMTGCVFWGATYILAENPAIDTLVRHMGDYQPTVFISIPMKWIQLFELIASEVNIEIEPERRVHEVVHSITGGKLCWGLSAAGYLDPDIFRFFQRNGVELGSGFGMTEATGGITMTPPGGYKEDSLGPALPGIELALGDDGELLVKGPYVMEGYLDPPDGKPSFDTDGWFPTGDLMEMDAEGFIRIVDRKKEIYKNVQGQTVAPQKIENLFRDFESVNRVFLVGDHRPYNTALIYPNLAFAEADLNTLSKDELRAHFRSLVVTANTFLAPYERIVDFAVIDRDFDTDQGELTAKNTYRRKTIERNFADTIRQLYQRATLSVEGLEVMVPNWLFQSLGTTSQDLGVDDDGLVQTDRDTRLTVRRLGPDEIQVGEVAYRYESSRPVNIGTLLSVPRLWLGNEQLVDFAPLEMEQRAFKRRRRLSIHRLRRLKPSEPSQQEIDGVTSLLHTNEPELMHLHPAARLIESGTREKALLGVRALEHVLEVGEGSVAVEARHILRGAANSPLSAVVRRSFQVLAVAERGVGYRSMIRTFLEAIDDLFDAETTGVLVERTLLREQLEAFFSEADAFLVSSHSDSASQLLHFLGEYGALHPSSYQLIRAFVTRAALTSSNDTLRAAARTALDRLRDGFHSWLGSQCRIAVDPETGFEYRWEDVVAFSDEIDEESRDRLLDALRSTTMIREGIFLFSHGSIVSLSDILPGGIWIRLLGSDHGKTVYRIAVKTRSRGQFDLAVNLNHTLTADEIGEEIDWLVVCSAGGDKGPLAEEFGGWWPDHGLWTEEFIGGDTLGRGLARLARRPRDRERLAAIWPYAAWSALSAYVDFWNRTGRTLEIADPTPANVVVPLHDYHTDARLVSISSRQRFTSVAKMLSAFRTQFIDPVERSHPELEGLATWAIPCAALLEVVGEHQGIGLMLEVLADPSTCGNELLKSEISDFLESVHRRGFLPRRLFFAGKRFRKWSRLNPDATTLARATTLQEIYSTYGLHTLRETYPEVRARYFRETVFQTGDTGLTEGLDSIITRLRRRQLEPDELSTAVADLRAHLDLDHEHDYFLARLSYPYLRPEDEAEFVATTAGGAQQSEMVVTVEDSQGDLYSIRHALSAKEVGRLHRLFLAAKLSVQFRPEHRFLVALSERGHLMGGLFYEVNPDLRTAHMDKVVVAESYQGRGIAGQLLEELCNRMRTAGLGSVTTGFFRPQFFYRYGFTVEKRYAGLVRQLIEEEDDPT